MADGLRHEGGGQSESYFSGPEKEMVRDWLPAEAKGEKREEF